LRLQAPNKETIYYVYITDQPRRLIGTISLRDLIMSKPHASLARIMETNLISVPHDMDIEEVAAVFSKYDLLAVPVVDKGTGCWASLPWTMSSISSRRKAPRTSSAYRRWSPLMKSTSTTVPPSVLEPVYLAGGVLFTSLISTTIMEANAAGPAPDDRFVLFYSHGHGHLRQRRHPIGHHDRTRHGPGGDRTQGPGTRIPPRTAHGPGPGRRSGLIAYFRVFLQDHHVLLGFIVASALVATLLTANLIGALLPLILKKIKLDPALTAGPFIATIIDAVGIAIYFQIAFLLMRHFQG
jgi:magnesium transporter